MKTCCVRFASSKCLVWTMALVIALININSFFFSFASPRDRLPSAREVDTEWNILTNMPLKKLITDESTVIQGRVGDSGASEVKNARYITQGPVGDRGATEVKNVIYITQGRVGDRGTTEVKNARYIIQGPVGDRGATEVKNVIYITQGRVGDRGTTEVKSARKVSTPVRGDQMITKEISRNKRLPVSVVSQITKTKESLIQKQRNKTDISIQGTMKPCYNISSSLVGRYHPTVKELTPEELTSMFPSLETGGSYSPSSCAPDQRVAIIIPYRDRWKHLHTLLAVLLRLMVKQNVAFTIFVIEQELPETFNKGVLFNVGYLEALNVSSYDCFIFHDVDMVPVDDRNTYRCSEEGPSHLAGYVDKFQYKLYYEGLFGGVVAFTKEQFRRINGASNIYFGWGAEDDDLRDRVVSRNYTIVRGPHGAYDMIKHSRGDSGWAQNMDRFKVFSTRLKRQDMDGLNSVVYKRRGFETLPLYTWIKVSINRTQILQRLPVELRQGDKPDLSYRKSVTVQKLKSRKS